MEDLFAIAPPPRRPALEQQRELLLRAGDREFVDAADKEAAKDGTLIS